MNELLFEVSQKLLEIHSSIHRNPIIEHEAGFNAEEIKVLQEKVSDAWRESMKSLPVKE